MFELPDISPELSHSNIMKDVLLIFLIFKKIFEPPHRAHGILIPQPSIKLTSPALEEQSLNHWTTREVPIKDVLNSIL